MKIPERKLKVNEKKRRRKRRRKAFNKRVDLRAYATTKLDDLLSESHYDNDIDDTQKQTTKLPNTICIVP